MARLKRIPFIIIRTCKLSIFSLIDISDPFVILKNVIESIGTTPMFTTFLTILNLIGKFAADLDMQNDESYVYFVLYFISLFY